MELIVKYYFNKKLKKYLYLFFLLIFPLVNTAQNLYVTKNFTTNDGLASNETYNVYSDKEGYLWFFTDRGVSKFDGKTFTNYNTQNGLPDNFVNKYFISSKGVMWVLCGLQSNMLAYYDGEKFVPYKYNNVLKDNEKNCSLLINLAFKNEIPCYFGTRNKGLFCITTDGKLDTTIYKNQPTEINKRFELFADFTNQVFGMKDFVATLKNYKFNSKINFKFLKEKYKFNIDGFISNLVIKNGYIYYSYSNHLFIIKNKEVIKDISFENQILNIFIDNINSLYVLLDVGQEIKIFKNCDFNLPQKSILKDYRCTAMCQDMEGGYWVCTHNEGVLYIPSMALKDIELPFLQKNEIPGAIQCTNKYDLVVGLHNYKIYAKQKNKWTNNLYENIEMQRAWKEYMKCNKTPNVKLESVAQNIKQINYFSKQKLIQPFYSGTSFAIDETNNKLKSIVSGEGGIIVNDATYLYLSLNVLGIVNNNKFNLRKYINIKADRAFCIFQNNKKEILIGTQTGVRQYIGDSIKILYPNEITNRVTQINQLQDSTIVYSTLGNGLYFYKNNKQIKHYLFTDRYKNCNQITKTILKNNLLYNATPQGVSILNIKDLQNITNQFISTNTGLPFNDIKDICVNDTSLHILTNKKIFNIEINNFKQNYEPPKIYVTQIILDTNDITNKKNISIKYNQKIKINYTGIAYRCGNNLLYQYRLLGLNDTNWQSTTQENIEFNTLPAGNYKFQIKAINENNIESKNYATYNFEVTAPFWKTFWFWSLCTLLLLLIGFLIYKYRIKKIKEQNKMRELVLNYEQQALASQINPHFIFNVINNIQSYILKEEKRKAHTYLSQFAKLMRLSLDNSREKWVSLKSEMELINLYMKLEMMRFETFDFKVSIQEEINIEQISVPSMIIQPYLENALKHGIFHLKDRRGEIKLTIYKKEKNIICEIEDNGVGRILAEQFKPKHKEHKSSGQTITKQRLELLLEENKQKKLFEVFDKPNNMGTKINLYLPYKEIFEY